MDYKCITTLDELREYINGAKILAFDFETSPVDIPAGQQGGAGSSQV